MDMQATLVHFDGDKEFLLSMFDTFLGSLPERLTEMDGAAQGERTLTNWRVWLTTLKEPA